MPDMQTRKTHFRFPLNEDRRLSSLLLKREAKDVWTWRVVNLFSLPLAFEISRNNRYLKCHIGKELKKGRTVTKSSNLTKKPLFCTDEEKSGIVAPVFLLLAFSGLTQKITGGRNSGNPRGMGGGRILRPMEKASLVKRNLPIWNFSTSPVFPWSFFKQGTWQIGSMNYQMFPQDNTKLIFLLGRANRPFFLPLLAREC